jgi:hypothetical protein
MSGCLVAALVVSVLCKSVLGESTTAPATKPAKNFAEEVLGILNIKDKGSDVLSLLADALAKQDGDAAAFGKSVNRLVDGLLAGPNPNVLVDKILATVHVEYASGFQDGLKDWKYGTRTSRAALSEKLWGLAVAAQSKDAKRAKDIATAACVFAALNYYHLNWRSLERIIGSDGADLKTKELLGLSEEQFKRFQEVVRTEGERMVTWSQELMPALEAVDEICGAPDKPLDSVRITKDVLSRFDKAYREGPSQAGCRWLIINNAWDVLNLARTRYDEAIQQLVRRQLEKWKREYPDPNTNRWIDEAFVRQATPKVKRVEHSVRLPDGRIVPDDGKIVPKEPPDSSK